MEHAKNNTTGSTVVKYRKREIEVLRLWCTIAVCMHHLRYCSESLPYGGGYLAVDFFFVLSGFYLRKGYITKVAAADSSIKKYIKNRYIRLFKDYIFAFMIALLVNVFVFKLDITSNLLLYVKEAFMVEIGCIESGLRVNPPDWYCGYLLLASIIVFALQKIIQKNVKIISLTLGIVLYVILAIISGHLCIFPLDSCIISWALARALAGQMIGVFLAEFIEQHNTRIIFQLRLKVLFFLLIAVVSYLLFWDMAFSTRDYLCVFMLVILIYISQFVEFKLLSAMNEKIWNVFPDLLYVVFLNHYVVVKLFKYFEIFSYADWKVISVFYITVVFIFSFVVLQLRLNLERIINITRRGLMNKR